VRAASATVIVALLCVMLLAGCGGSSPDPTATAVPPTATPVPPTPTPIAYEVPDLVSTYINAAQPTAHETFDTLSVEEWTYTPGSVTTSQGEVQLTGVENWGSSLYRAETVTENTAMLLRFRADTDAEFGIFVEADTWGTEAYKRFGSYGPYPETNIFHGTVGEPRQIFDGELTVRADTWYNLMIAVGPGGEFVALVWDPADSSQHLAYRRVVDAGWTGASWLFGITINSGFLAIDDFVVASFDGLAS
jgi:hypothetical protein